MASDIETIYRTYQIPKRLRIQMAEHREKTGLRQQDLIAAAVKENLDTLLSSLVSLNIKALKSTGPARYPMVEDILKSLRAASTKVGIPASTLLVACLAQATSGGTPEKTSSSRSNSQSIKSRSDISKAQGNQKKAVRRQRKVASK